MPKHDVAHTQQVNDLLVEEIGDTDWVIDLFPAVLTEETIYAPHLLARFESELVDGALFNPPTSFRQAEKYIKAFGMKWDGRSSWWSAMKDDAAHIIKKGGKCVSISWDSTGLGISRGFVLERLLIVNHGGHWRDTIVTVERKGGAKADAEWVNTVRVGKEWFPTPEDPIF